MANELPTPRTEALKQVWPYVAPDQISDCLNDWIEHSEQLEKEVSALTLAVEAEKMETRKAVVLALQKEQELLAKRANAVEWIPVSERLPEQMQDVSFVVDCPRHDYLHGRVLGGKYIGGVYGFSVPGMSVNASHWHPSLPPPGAEPAKEE